MRRLVVAVVVIAAVVVGRAGAATAAAPQAMGWWWEAEQGAPVPAPPTVPTGGFMVGADPSGTDAVAALRFELPPDQTDPVITLSVASNGAVNDAGASIVASRASKPWTAAAPGNWADRPSGVAPAVQGVRSADGTTWTFNVAALLNGTTLDIVLEPNPATSFQVAFNPPDGKTLRTSPRPAPAATASDDAGATGASPDAVAPAVSDAGALVPTPAVASAPASQDISLEVTPPQQQGSAALASPTVPGSAKSHAAAGVAFAILLIVLAMGWALSRVPAPALRGLGPITTKAAPARVVRPERPQVGGLGRFARPRVGPPPKL